MGHRYVSTHLLERLSLSTESEAEGEGLEGEILIHCTFDILFTVPLGIYCQLKFLNF